VKRFAHLLSIIVTGYAYIDMTVDKVNCQLKGRTGPEQLNETEQFMFSSYLLNTALTGSLTISGNAGKNLTSGTALAQGSRIIKDEWDNKGGREYSDLIKNDPPLVPHSRALVKRVLE
jgi:hypothetical protein|tara:strand:+ start:1755 stop:2108 length:354 start_codon:yes stop_codon:yes gene_type:complete